MDSLHQGFSIITNDLKYQKFSQIRRELNFEALWDMPFYSVD